MPKTRGNSELKRIYLFIQTTIHWKYQFTYDCYSQGQFPLICWLKYHGVKKWRAQYFKHNKSYYPVPQTSMEFANVNFSSLCRRKLSDLRLKQL